MSLGSMQFHGGGTEGEIREQRDGTAVPVCLRLRILEMIGALIV